MAVGKSHLLDKRYMALKKKKDDIIKIYILLIHVNQFLLRGIFGISKTNHGEHISNLFIKVEILIFCLWLVFSSFLSLKMSEARGYF